jgi:hypothetical protein
MDVDDERADIMKTATMLAAKNLLSQSMLFAETRKPQIACYSSDFMHGTEDIEIALDEPSEEY